MPAANVRLLPDDEILICSTRDAEKRVRSNLVNIYTLEYLVSGNIPIRGSMMNWLAERWRLAG